MSSSWGHASMMKFDADNITEYGYLTLSGDQTTGLSADDPIKFNQREGNIKFDSGTYRVTLKSGITYKLSANCKVTFDAAASSLTYVWYDITNSQELGKRGTVRPTTHVQHSHSEPLADAIVTPSTDVEVEVRILSNANGTTISNTQSSASVITIGTLRGFGPAKDYCLLTLSGDQSSLSQYDTIEFDQSQGSIQFNSSTYRATLKSGVTYKLRASLFGLTTTSTGSIWYQWYDITNTQYIGKESGVAVVTHTSYYAGGEGCIVVVTPSTDIEVELRVVGSSVISTLWERNSYAFIETLESVIPENRNANLVSQEIQKEYGYLTLSGDQTTGLSADDPIKFDTRTGDIGFNAGTYRATLKAGVTYKLQATVLAVFTGSTGNLNYKWWDVTNSQQLGKNGLSYPMSSNSNNSMELISDAVVTPETDIEVELRINQIANISRFESDHCSAFIESIDTIISTVKHRDNNPAGIVIMRVDSNVPDGYLECNGQAISRTGYADLFAITGETYGNGDASTTYNVPDYRGYFLRGWDHGAATDPDRASRTDRGDGTTGDYVGTKQADEYESHRHNMRVDDSSPSSTQTVQYGDSSPKYTNANSMNYAGGNETRPKNVNVMYCIKY